MDEMTNYARAVSERGTNIAVSASAGCGKTTTMINRVADIIINDGADITDFLIVTFTRAAAQEMRQKLRQELKKRCADGGHTACELSLQIEKAELADISTIHSFCTGVCREYFNIAQLPPDFTVMEEAFSHSFKSKAMQRLIERCYNRDDVEFFELSQIFGGRSDDALSGIIDGLYGLTVTLSDEKRFVDSTALACFNADLAQNPAASYLKTQLLRCCEKVESKSLRTAALALKCGLDNDVQLMRRIAGGAAQIKHECTEDVRAGFAALRLFLDERLTLKAIARNADDSQKHVHAQVKAVRDEVTTRFDKLNKCAADIAEPDTPHRLKGIQRHCTALLRLTREFKEIYSSLKLKEGLLDFNDLEYYAHTILCDEGAREALKNRYRYIFIDEFQDTNRVQDAIIGKLCQDNVFLVGDKKQSIYSFRGAESGIFTEKLAQPDYLGLTLSRNFRSGSGLLEFVNTVFSHAMTPEFSHISYIAEDMLTGSGQGVLDDGLPPAVISLVKPERSANPPLPEGVYSVSAHAQIVDEFSGGGGTSCEAAEIAAIIDRLTSFPTRLNCTKQQLEKRHAAGLDEYICHDDIAVLVRTKRTFTERLYRDLTKLGVPVLAEFSYSLTDYPEILALIDMLKVIDNPCRDIELASVLCGTFCGLDMDELAELRIAFPRERFHLIPALYAKSFDDSAAQKLNTFLQRLQSYRDLSRALSGANLLRRVAADFNYQDWLLSHSGGQDAAYRADCFIQSLHADAGDLSAVQLLRYIEETGDKIKLSPKAATGGGKVRLTTVHNSKGLEYPIVIFAGCSEKFLFLESRSKLICDRTAGLAMDFYDYDNRTRYPSFTRGALGLMQQHRQVREEINILYVAMTRAKYRLYITGTAPADDFSLPKEPEDIKYANCYLDIILGALKPQAQSAFASDCYVLLTQGVKAYTNTPPASVEAFNAKDASTAEEECAATISHSGSSPHLSGDAESTAAESLCAAINTDSTDNVDSGTKGQNVNCDKNKTTFAGGKGRAQPLNNYLYRNDTLIPLKNTVTARAAAILEQSEQLPSAFSHDAYQMYGSDSAVDTGNAYHKLLENIDLTLTAEQLNGHISRADYLTEVERAAIDVGIMEKLWDTELFMLARKYPVYREKAFMRMVFADSINYDSGEQVLLQGIIDLLIITPQGAVIADYKFSRQSAERLREYYGPQLEQYRIAVQSILGIEHIKCHIVQIPLARVIKL